MSKQQISNPTVKRLDNLGTQIEQCLADINLDPVRDLVEQARDTMNRIGRDLDLQNAVESEMGLDRYFRIEELVDEAEEVTLF